MRASGKRPTRLQMTIMVQNKLDPREWLVVKNLNHQLVIIHRTTSEQKILEI